MGARSSSPTMLPSVHLRPVVEAGGRHRGRRRWWGGPGLAVGTLHGPGVIVPEVAVDHHSAGGGGGGVERRLDAAGGHLAGLAGVAAGETGDGGHAGSGLAAGPGRVVGRSRGRPRTGLARGGAPSDPGLGAAVPVGLAGGQGIEALPEPEVEAGGGTARGRGGGLGLGGDPVGGIAPGGGVGMGHGCAPLGVPSREMQIPCQRTNDF